MSRSPVRVRNDPGALHGARHRPRTSGGVSNRGSRTRLDDGLSPQSSASRSRTPSISPKRVGNSPNRVGTAPGRSRSRSRATSPKLPPLAEGLTGTSPSKDGDGNGSGSGQMQMQMGESVMPKLPPPKREMAPVVEPPPPHHAYAKNDAKPLRSRTPLPTDNMKKRDPALDTEEAKRRRVVKHFDKIRQFAYVRNSKLTDMFMKYNMNGDNVIDYNEFLLMLNAMNMDKFLSETEMKEMFEFADPDGSGGIELPEWNALFDAQEPLARKEKKKVGGVERGLELRSCGVHTPSCFRRKQLQQPTQLRQCSTNIHAPKCSKCTKCTNAQGRMNELTN